MIAWLRQHADALRRAFRRSTRPAGLLGALVIGVALSLPAGGYALLEGARALGARANLDPQIHRPHRLLQRVSPDLRVV